LTIVISPATLAKLSTKHNVTAAEVQECFENISGGLLIDDREDHKSDPPTLWFVAVTKKRRLLKVCFVQRGGEQHVRTAYPPLALEVRIYRTKAVPTPTDL
jgi:hypothetical protein